MVEAGRLRGRGRWWLVPFTLGLAIMASTMPLPQGVAAYWPDWVSLVLVYWCLAMPHRVGPTSGFFVGLLIDVVQFSVLGQNALSKAVLGYLAAQFHLPVRLFPLWQQSIVVGVLLSLDTAIVVWIHGIVSGSTVAWSAWWPAFTGMLAWPVLFVILRGARRRAQLA